MKYKLIVYNYSNNNICIDEIKFNHPKELCNILDEYMDYPYKIIDLETSNPILEGALDYACLNEEYYK